MRIRRLFKMPIGATLVLVAACAKYPDTPQPTVKPSDQSLLNQEFKRQVSAYDAADLRLASQIKGVTAQIRDSLDGSVSGEMVTFSVLIDNAADGVFFQTSTLDSKILGSKSPFDLKIANASQIQQDLPNADLSATGRCLDAYCDRMSLLIDLAETQKSDPESAQAVSSPTIYAGYIFQRNSHGDFDLAVEVGGAVSFADAWAQRESAKASTRTSKGPNP